MCNCQTSFLGQIGISIKCCVSFVPLPQDATYHSSGKTLKLRHPSFQGGFVVGGFVRSVCSFFHYSSSRSSFHCFSHYTNHIHIPGILKYFVMIPICLGSISSLIYSEQTGFFHLLIYAGNEALPLTISIIHQVTGPSHLALLSCHRVRSAEALARHEKYLEKQSSWWGSMGIFTWN